MGPAIFIAHLSLDVARLLTQTVGHTFLGPAHNSWINCVYPTCITRVHGVFNDRQLCAVCHSRIKSIDTQPYNAGDGLYSRPQLRRHYILAPVGSAGCHVNLKNITHVSIYLMHTCTKYHWG